MDSQPMNPRHKQVWEALLNDGARCFIEIHEAGVSPARIYQVFSLKDGRVIIVEGIGGPDEDNGVEVYSNEMTPNKIPEIIEWLTKK